MTIRPLKQSLQEQIDIQLVNLQSARLVGAIERRWAKRSTSNQQPEQPALTEITDAWKRRRALLERQAARLTGLMDRLLVT